MELQTIPYWPQSYRTVFEASDPVSSFLSRIAPNVAALDCLNGTGLGCPSRCVEPQWIFGSLAVPSPLWSCIIWPNITKRSLARELSDSQENVLAASGINTTLPLARNISFAISDCLTAYCQDLKGCDVSDSSHTCSANSMVLNNSVLSIDALGTCLETICEHQHQTYANPDIAGVGVVRAYIIQLFTAVISIPAMWCLHLLHWFRVRLKHTTNQLQSTPERRFGLYQQKAVFSLLRSLTGVGDLVGLRYRASQSDRPWPTNRLENSLKASLQRLPLNWRKKQSWRHARDRFLSFTDRVYFASLAALPEFLKAQCFFSLAISIAALTLTRSGAELSAIDQSALWAASHSGISPVGITFCIFSALTWNRPSWYLLIITSVTWTFSLYITSLVKFTGVEVSPASNREWPNACANVPPANICGTAKIYDLTDQSDKFLKALGVFGVGAGIVTISQLARLICRRDSESSELEEAELGTSTLFFYQFPMFCMFFAAENTAEVVRKLYQSGAVDRDWTFGQIVAVTVWVPPLTSFLNTLLDGLPDAHSKLLPAGFQTISLDERLSSRHERAHVDSYRPALDSSATTLAIRRASFIH